MNGVALWVYLSASPLFWLSVTVVVFLVSDHVALAFGRHPLANPVLMSLVAIGLLLKATGTPYRAYFDGAQFVHFLLGPATVALGVPLWRNRKVVVREILPMAAALVVGSIVAIVSAVGIARALGAPGQVVASLAPKSVTAPVAMAISETVGGLPSLTAGLVIITGILGAVMVSPTMNALGIRDWAARGFSVGLASHGIGTARAFTVHPIAGVFAGIAMGLNAVVTAVLVPLIMTMMR
jgi:predicted murein hydrolase (TIGR00659 family)